MSLVSEKCVACRRDSPRVTDAEAAEAEGHHPRLTVEWGSVVVEWWTHVISGLHCNDFVMATKTDEIYGLVSPAGR